MLSCRAVKLNSIGKLSEFDAYSKNRPDNEALHPTASTPIRRSIGDDRDRLGEQRGRLRRCTVRMLPRFVDRGSLDALLRLPRLATRSLAVATACCRLACQSRNCLTGEQKRRNLPGKTRSETLKPQICRDGAKCFQTSDRDHRLT
jgi:hypothetical protein